jgi:hypothetical protein
LLFSTSFRNVTWVTDKSVTPHDVCAPMPTLATRKLRFLATLCLGVASTSCIVPTGTDARLSAYLGIIPAMSQDAARIYSGIDDFGMAVNNLRVAITRESGAILYDTTIALAPGQDSVVLEFLVPLTQAKELVAAHVELRDSAIVVFGGSESVELQRGGAPSVTPVIELDYRGPGALARAIDLTPRDTTIAARTSLGFLATALDGYGAPLRNVQVAWSVSDPTKGTIGLDGVFQPKGRGETWVIARLPTGLRDSARVAVSAK